jgi:hypothetical protein
VEIRHTLRQIVNVKGEYGTVRVPQRGPGGRQR